MDQAGFVLFTALTEFPDGPGRENYPLFGAFPPAINLLCIGFKPVQSFFAVEQ